MISLWLKGSLAMLYPQTAGTAGTSLGTCQGRTFHVLPLEETEGRVESLRRCRLTTYAEMFHKALAKTPCASDLKEAEVVIIPGYTFSNCHWPHYGDNCSRAGSLFRKGKDCNDLQSVKEYLGGGNSNIFVIFTPKIGEDFQFDEHIFQMGGSTTNQVPTTSSSSWFRHEAASNRGW